MGDAQQAEAAVNWTNSDDNQRAVATVSMISEVDMMQVWVHFRSIFVVKCLIPAKVPGRRIVLGRLLSNYLP